MRPLGAGYLFEGLLILVFLLPLRRSAQALLDLGGYGTSAALESFAVHQSTFWRRTGIFTVVMVVLIVLGFAAAVIVGVMMAGGR